jgi:GNAT superfamily N-acetyltransferase
VSGVARRSTRTLAGIEIVTVINIVIRQAQREDASRLHELHTASVRALCSEHYSSEIIDGWLQNRSAIGYLTPIERDAIFVAERDSTIVGFGEAAPGVVVAVYVAPSAVHQGIGSAILRHAIEMARRAHDGPLRVESTLNASPFYERHGFREVKRSTIKRNLVEVPMVVMEMPANHTVEKDARKSGTHPSL